jgi:competence protein ComGC
MLMKLLAPKRRWAQFSLASMFVVVTVICMWLALRVNQATRQRDAVVALRKLGAVGAVFVALCSPPP